MTATWLDLPAHHPFGLTPRPSRALSPTTRLKSHTVASATRGSKHRAFTVPLNCGSMAFDPRASNARCAASPVTVTASDFTVCSGGTLRAQSAVVQAGDVIWLKTISSGDTLMLDAANAQRYQPYVALAQAADAQTVAAVYFRFYPLLQQAYQALGYPHGYFNERVIRVLAHLRAAPAVAWGPGDGAVRTGGDGGDAGGGAPAPPGPWGSWGVGGRCARACERAPRSVGRGQGRLRGNGA